MTLYRENTTDPTEKKKKTIRTKKHSKVAGYKLNIQIYVAFYKVINLSEREIEKTISFTIHQKEQNT